MKIAVWYHCVLRGDKIPSEDHTLRVLQQQMRDLAESGLADAAQEIHIGVNGDSGDALLVGCFCPAKAQLHVHGRHACSELPTLARLHDWLAGKDDSWQVLYFHLKGAAHPHNAHVDAWRARMERVCVHDWKYCVGSLVGGVDTCGAHWLTPERFTLVSIPYWGGNFWWATSKFLRTLPPPKPDSWENRYEAEVWIGRGQQKPRVKDYYPGWP